MTPRTSKFVIGFAVGAGLIALVNFTALKNSVSSEAINFGVWIDVGFQALIAGAVLGVLAGRFSNRPNPPTEPR